MTSRVIRRSSWILMTNLRPHYYYPSVIVRLNFRRFREKIFHRSLPPRTNEVSTKWVEERWYFLIGSFITRSRRIRDKGGGTVWPSNFPPSEKKNRRLRFSNNESLLARFCSIPAQFLDFIFFSLRAEGQEIFLIENVTP